MRYTATRPYVVTTNSTNVDLAALLAPAKKPRRRTTKSVDAAVGGGLGAADLVEG